MSDIVFGINGGGTFSRMRVERGVRHLGTFHSGGINPCANPKANIETHIAHLFQQARRSLGLAHSDYKSGCIGSAGLERGRDNSLALLRAMLKNADIRVPVDLCNDAEILLMGCCGEADGSIVIAGTGSIALAKCAETMRRFGGYGHVLGDEGSAYWIATRMFTKLLRDAEDGECVSLMAEALLSDMKEKTHGEYASIEVVIPYVYSLTDKAEFARHAAVLSEELIACDEAARALAGDAAQHLHALFQRMSKWCPKATRCVFVDGGVFENAFIRMKFTALCEGVRVTLVGADERAERGACMLARKIAQA